MALCRAERSVEPFDVVEKGAHAIGLLDSFTSHVRRTASRKAANTGICANTENFKDDAERLQCCLSSTPQRFERN